jgi:putative hydrolase of the HAD superfamily
LTRVSWQELLEDYRGYFDGYCLNLPGLADMLSTLKAQNRALGIITNGPSPFQEQKIKAMGIADYFAVILVSGALGLKKPDPEIFRRAVNQLEVTARETVFVGDNPTADILGAQAVGMPAVWKRVPFWDDCPTADAVCDDLAQLPGIIQGLETKESKT